MDEVLELHACISLLIQTPFDFGLHKDLYPQNIMARVRCPALLLFFSTAILTSVQQGIMNDTSSLSSAAQLKECSKHTGLPTKWPHHYASRGSCVLWNQAYRNWESTKVTLQSIVPVVPDLYVHVTKAIKLQLQQVLPQLCKCSLFLKESKGTGPCSSQHNHHLLLLFFFSCLQYYQLTIHTSTVNVK